MVANRSLVFLEGESGSGKSALVRSGLLPALTGDAAESILLPIYVSDYGTDWVTGPATQVVSALWKTLNSYQRQKLEITSRGDLHEALWSATNPEKPEAQNDQTTTDQPVSIWSQIEIKLGQTPLLIFDQFDDYQAQHRDRFLRQGQWLTMKQLAIDKSTRNPFWVEICRALQDDHIHCLFVTRRDAFSGLEAVRFVEPKAYYLERLEPAFIIALLKQLVMSEEAKSAVIAHPQAGWDALKARLIDDLAYQRRILPIQACIALEGLIGLPYLSLSTYEHVGRVAGLEAAYIEDGVKLAADSSGTDENIVMQVLLQPVDRSHPDIPKTRSSSSSALHELTKASVESLQRMLSSLEQKRIIRSRIKNADEDRQNDDPQWSLYHDYLAPAVISAHRKTNRWQQLLDEQQKAFKQATTWSAKWKALLSPWQLVRLLWDRLRAPLSFAGYRSYLAMSTLRFLPYLMIFLFILLAWNEALNWQAHQDAKRILTSITSTNSREPPQSEELRRLWELAGGSQRLWELAGGSQRLKDSFIKEAIRDIASREKVFERRAYIAQAVWGMDPQTHKRRTVLEHLLQASKQKTESSDASDMWLILWALDIFNSASIIASAT